MTSNRTYSKHLSTKAQTWQSKRQILSIFANDFSRSELQTLIPGLTKWQIDQARDHATKSGKGQPVDSNPIFRTRLDPPKVDHFLDFVSRPEFLQDVAFGTKTMKMDSGKHITIPAVVRTLIPTRIIEQYFSYCKQQQFEPAGERSLYRVLEVCSASMQKSQQGLDNITAEGTEAIDDLSNIVQKLVNHGADNEWPKNTRNEIKEVKRYLKTDYRTHIGREENCGDHCSTYALSDPAKEEYQSECTHPHDIECDRCQTLERMLNEIEAKINSTSMDEWEKSSMKFDFNQCNDAIRSWKAHLLRTVLQEEAKHDAMNKLDEETCLVIIDWAMKFLPLKYRESMAEFFGKRGLSWHISAVVTKHETKYEVECFVHIFNNCVQNNYAVAAILDHLFKTIKAEYPPITKAYLRSDNAGCYHNGPLILHLADIGNRTGVSAIRYDFSDPQAGKDICDRKTAPMKAHIRRYVNEKHDVVTAEDMKTAIESHGGLTGCRVAVVEVDSSKDLDDTQRKIPGISLLYNFKYEEGGVRMWKAYNIGEGVFLSSSEILGNNQVINPLKMIQPFASRQKQPGVIRSTRVTNDSAPQIFGCNENSCILTFKTEEEAQAHMDAGDHVKELESMSAFDTIRKKWADTVVGISNQPHIRAPDSTPGESTVSEVSRQKGWALKTTKDRKRFEEKVKKFLIEKFNEGERTGNKPEPSSVADEMKRKVDENGKPYFEPSDWKTSQQIKSFFSRHNSKMKQMNTGAVLTTEDVEAWEAEVVRQHLRDEVRSNIEPPQHPIEAEQVNICLHFHQGTLTSLKLQRLKSICQALSLTIDGSKAKKQSFVDALKNLVKECGCDNPL